MMKKILALTILFLLAGCTLNQKYVEIRIDDESCLFIEGGISPDFMREGTTEDFKTDAKPNVDLDVVPIP